MDEETKQLRAEERAAYRAKIREARRLQKEREKKIQPIRRSIKVHVAQTNNCVVTREKLGHHIAQQCHLQAEIRKRRQFARMAVTRIYDAEHDVVFQHKPQILEQHSPQGNDLASLLSDQVHVAASRFGLTEIEVRLTFSR